MGIGWEIAHHVLTFDRLLAGAIEVAVVLAAAVLVRRERAAHSS